MSEIILFALLYDSVMLSAHHHFFLVTRQPALYYTTCFVGLLLSY